MFAFGSKDGYIYEKEAILQYILHQKTEIAKKMKVVLLNRGLCSNTMYTNENQSAKKPWLLHLVKHGLSNALVILM